MFMVVISCHTWPYSWGIIWRLPGFRGVYWHPYPSYFFYRVCTDPRLISTGSPIPYSCSGVQ